MLAARVGGHRRGSPRYSYNAGSAGFVDGAGYPARNWGVVGFVFGESAARNLARRSSIQADTVTCTRDRLLQFIIGKCTMQYKAK